MDFCDGLMYFLLTEHSCAITISLPPFLTATDSVALMLYKSSTDGGERLWKGLLTSHQNLEIHMSACCSHPFGNRVSVRSAQRQLEPANAAECRSNATLPIGEV